MNSPKAPSTEALVEEPDVTASLEMEAVLPDLPPRPKPVTKPPPLPSNRVGTSKPPPPVVARPAASVMPAVAPAPLVPAVAPLAPTPDTSAIAAPLSVTTDAPRPTTVPPPSQVRMHVSVKASVRDPNLFVVRPLAEGQAPPPGTRVAYLLLGDGDVELLRPSNGSGTP